MSTDDLMTRVRDHLAHTDTLPHGLAIALVSELADEVARLRAAITRHEAYYQVSLVQELRLTAERDAARAALERVRAAVADNWGRVGMDPGARLPMLTGEIRLALEGES